MRISSEEPSWSAVPFVRDYRRQMVLGVFFLTIFLLSAPVLGSAGPCLSGIFSFGDSLSDTGNKDNLFPIHGVTNRLPYGQQFFTKPSKRFCNGRIILDFLALAFGRKPLLQPYIQTGAYDYRFGVNFAFSGAGASGAPDTTPVSLTTQILQFLNFKEETENVLAEEVFDHDHIKLPTKEVFEDALYYIEIGGNDLMHAVFDGRTPSFILDNVIPAITNIITWSVQTLHANGARRFLLFNTPCAGCNPKVLTSFGKARQLDSMGCVEFMNEYNRANNEALRSVVGGLRSQFLEAQIDIFDFYAANVEILDNPTAYGFDPEKTMTACCGVGGQYNFSMRLRCGNRQVPVCVVASFRGCNPTP